MKTSNILVPATPDQPVESLCDGNLSMFGLSGSLVTMEIVLVTVLGNH